MGACSFDDVLKIPKATSDDEAFSLARERAAHERGHGGYTGTIAEKHSCLRLHKASSEAAAMRIKDNLLSQPYGTPDLYREEVKSIAEDKWGPAAAIRFPVSETEDGIVFFGSASY